MVISSGLNGDEEIVTNVPPSVTDGSQITVRGAGGEKGGAAAEGKEVKKGGERKGDKAKNAPAKDDASREAK
jgi:hypothetical protein